MTTLSDLLRDADPLAREPRRNEMERRASRTRVLDAPPSPNGLAMPSRRVAMAAAAAIVATAAAAGYWSRLAVDVVAAVRFEVRLAEDSPGAGLTQAAGPGGKSIYLRTDSVVGNGDILKAEAIPGSKPGTFGVAITFSGAGAAKMSRASASHIGKPMAILIDGKVVMAPTVRAAISSSAVISGDFTRAEATRIVEGVIGK